MLLTNWN